MFLIGREVNIEAANNNKWTPLHFAVQKGHKEIVELLITAAIDSRKKKGQKEDEAIEQVINISNSVDDTP
jgi:ankyrin repeat protein